MPGSPQSDDQVSSERFSLAAPDGRSRNSDLPSNLQVRTNLEERELEAALQLLVERAQYITGATGTALALPQGDEMVCRASAGECAPTVGARLQVRSGLTGESIARGQLLRCDNAEADPRVNLETCRALGIASIVVLPLLRRTGEVRGLFELFSDHPYAFEERDLVALERMAALTLTALDLAEQRHDAVAPAGATAERTRTEGQATTSKANTMPSQGEAPPRPFSPAIPDLQVGPFSVERVSVPLSESGRGPELVPAADAEPSKPETATTVESAASISAPVFSTPGTSAPDISSPVIGASETTPEPAPIPEAMLRVQKCASCGFPVSEGRTLCLDCESLERLKIESEKKAHEKAVREGRQMELTKANPGPQLKAAETEDEAIQDGSSSKRADEDHAAEPSVAVTQEEILPAFLTNPQLVEESWLARHVNLLAFLVLIAMVLVAVVVFFR